MSYKEVLDLLAGVGITPEHFEQSNKSLDDLYREVTEREVILRPSSDGRHVLRCALSVKIRISNPEQGMELLETSRYYPRTDRVVTVANPEWTIRETRRRGEVAVLAASRGCWEELGLKVEPSEFEAMVLKLRDNQDIHESTVYPAGILSAVTTEWFWLETSALDCTTRCIIKEGNTEVVLRPRRLRPH